MINEDERWKNIESIDIKVRMQKERLEKERCLPSTLKSINMINEDERVLRVLTLRLRCRKRDWKKKDAYLLSHDMKSIERVLKVLMLRLGCRKRNWKKRDAYLLLLHLLT